jgi:hypothetical protein
VCFRQQGAALSLLELLAAGDEKARLPCHMCCKDSRYDLDWSLHISICGELAVSVTFAPLGA